MVKTRNISLLLLILFIITVTSEINFTIIGSASPNQMLTPIIPKGFKIIGELPNNTIVQVSIYIPLRNLNLLQSLAVEISTPGNPLYHKFLSYNEISELFLPISTYNEVVNYLKQYNLTIVTSALDSVIVVQGTVRQIYKALGINFLLLSNGSVEYYTGVGEVKLSGVSVFATNYTMLFFSHPNFLITQKQQEKIAQTENLTEIIAAYNLPQMALAYNATVLYKQGDYGNGTNIGIIDFYGDPDILQQLAYFDKLYNLPPPPSVKIVPIGPYLPGLGILTGWAIEESLDVEAVHSIAPMSNITIYTPSIGDLAAIIGYIDQQHEVNVVSMSFGLPESEASGFLAMIEQTEYYFMLGTLEGITFVASSGDGGGELYSVAQPLGGTSWPATSPFVTAVGGTTVYLSGNSSVQEAWSCSPGGGASTGGVSIIFPKPWYQEKIKGPFNFIDGRLTPDIALNANIYPGVNVILPGNISLIVGGTSESSPLFAGLLGLLISKLHTKFGLINPLIYKLAESDYNKAFYPVTFGYNLPWTVNYGYNLVTGWGAPNIGYWLYLINSTESNTLEINISVLPHSEEYFQGQKIKVIANITYNGKEVTTGNFTITVESLRNEYVYPMKFNGSLWTGNVTISNVSGIVYIMVNGSYNNIKGVNLIEVFVGYLFSLFSINQFTEHKNVTVTEISGFLYYLNGSLAVNVTHFTLNIYYYNPLSNNYVYETNITLEETTFHPYIRIISLQPIPFQFTQWYGETNTTLQPTATLLVGDGEVYGFSPTALGLTPLGSLILSPILASPEVVSPNESVLVEAGLFTSLYAFFNGYNITASLMSPNGTVLSSQQLNSEYLIIPPFLYVTIYIAYLHIPVNVKPGYYIIYLNVTGEINNVSKLIGYEGYQIYVAPYYLTPHIQVENYALQGQKITFYANITYANGTEVKYGIFTALVFPKQIESQYSSLSEEYLIVQQVMLTYNSTLGEWEGSYILPSVSSLGNATYLNPGYFTGEFDIYVQGLSFNGMPTTTNINSLKSFVVLPYTLISNQNLDSLIPINVALENDNITYNGSMENVLMLGVNRLHGIVNLINANITGTLIIYNSNVTLVGSYANNLIVINSTIYLLSSTVKSITLENSKIDLMSSKLLEISPKIPLVNILTKPGNYTGVINITANIIGSDIRNVTFYLNGIPIYVSTNNGTITFTLNTSRYPDGNYELSVIAYQKDGLSNSSSINLNFYNNLITLNNKINETYNALHTQYENLSVNLNNIYKTLSSNISISDIIGILGVILAVIAIALSLVNRRKK